MITAIDKFREHKNKAKDVFSIKLIDKSQAYDFIRMYHYLKGAKFFSKFAYGLFYKPTDELVGVATFSNPQGISAMKGWFSLDNQDQSVLELSRLAVIPSLNHTNATSYLLGNSIKLLKKDGIRAVITLATSDRHVGSIYQVCNFKYYGLTDAKTDFFTEDGRVNPRGPTKDVRGVWIPRPRKHRYAFIIDKSLKCNYQECDRPKIDAVKKLECCNGTGKVYDKRFGVWFTCPRCSGHIENVPPISKVIMERNNERRKSTTI